jgi:plasmid maintenance system antidote protein VapI
MARNFIGDKLKELGKSPAWLAEKSGVSESTTRRIIANKTAAGPRVQDAIAISKALGLGLAGLDSLWEF